MDPADCRRNALPDQSWGGGQPRDTDWRAAFAIYDSVAREVVYHRVPYDLDAAQERVLLAGLPKHLAARLREGR